METPVNRAKKNQGMNWISQHKRLAIYLRDGLACVYCRAGVESAERLTLDHITPYSHGGSNKESNLVTCCLRCNSCRGNRSVADFAPAIAEYLNHGTTGEQIINHIDSCLNRPLDVKYAKGLIALRGSCSKVLLKQ